MRSIPNGSLGLTGKLKSNTSLMGLKPVLAIFGSTEKQGQGLAVSGPRDQRCYNQERWWREDARLQLRGLGPDAPPMAQAGLAAPPGPGVRIPAPQPPSAEQAPWLGMSCL